MDHLIGGVADRACSGREEQVRSPFDGAVIDTVPSAGVEDVDRALTAAVAGAATGRRTLAHEQMRILLKAAELADERADSIALTLSAENGKAISEARGEASRSGALIRLAAFEGTQLNGETLPLDANPGTGFDKVGFTVRQSVRVVVAITPFNYSALLVLHKIAPALAAGNAVVLKPARTTPLTALALAACFVDAGLPEGVLSVQRVITHPAIAGDLLDALVPLVPLVEKIRIGDPSSTDTTMGTLITQGEAQRVERSIADALAGGAQLLTGGKRDGAVITPAVITGIDAAAHSPRTSCTVRPSPYPPRRTGRRRSRSQRHRLRAGSRSVHQRRGRRGAGDPGDRRRHHPHQLDPAVAGRSDALWAA